jgi:hypothetical protein
VPAGPIGPGHPDYDDPETEVPAPGNEIGRVEQPKVVPGRNDRFGGRRGRGGRNRGGNQPQRPAFDRTGLPDDEELEREARELEEREARRLAERANPQSNPQPAPAYDDGDDDRSDYRGNDYGNTRNDRDDNDRGNERLPSERQDYGRDQHQDEGDDRRDEPEANDSPMVIESDRNQGVAPPLPEAAPAAMDEAEAPAKKPKGRRAAAPKTPKAPKAAKTARTSTRKPPASAVPPPPPVVPTGSADKHLVDDEPVAPSDAPITPTSFDDLDALPDFDDD